MQTLAEIWQMEKRKNRLDLRQIHVVTSSFWGKLSPAVYTHRPNRGRNGKTLQRQPNSMVLLGEDVERERRSNSLILQEGRCWSAQEVSLSFKITISHSFSCFIHLLLLCYFVNITLIFYDYFKIWNGGRTWGEATVAFKGLSHCHVLTWSSYCDKENWLKRGGNADDGVGTHWY